MNKISETVELEEGTFEVEYYYSPEEPDQYYDRNGDPGTPGTPPEIEITTVTYKNVDVTEIIDAEIIDEIEKELWTLYD